MNEFVISTIVGILTGVGGWFAARERNRAETKISELDAVEKAVKVWRELSEELQTRYDQLLATQVELEKEMLELRSKMSTLKRENEQLKKKVTTLMKPE